MNKRATTQAVRADGGEVIDYSWFSPAGGDGNQNAVGGFRQSRRQAFQLIHDLSHAKGVEGAVFLEGLAQAAAGFGGG